MLRRAAVTDHRHQERHPRRLEVANDRHAGEPAIQQEQSGPDAHTGGLTEQTLDPLLERSPFLTPVRATVERCPLRMTEAVA